MGSGKKNNLSSLEGYFLLPDWWISSFIQSLKNEGSAFNSSSISKIFPIFTTEELNALLNILALVQEAVLFSEDPINIKIDLNKYRKNFTLPRQHFFSYDRVAQFFTTLSFLTTKNNQSTKKTSFKTRKIISSFSLESDSDFLKSESTHSYLNIELNSLGLSSCIGYYNPYQLILDSDFDIPIGSRPPIIVSSSTWADLSIQEQLLFLAMKKSMYWDSSWLHFDGIFGTDFSYIKSLITPFLSTRSRYKSPDLKDFIDKISKKLLEHGFLTHCSSSSYLAMGELSQKNLFIWQASLKELSLLSDNLFLTNCLIKVSSFIKRDFLKLTKILSANLISTQDSLRLKDFYELVIKKHPMYFYPLLDKSTLSPIPMVWLFIEWCLRNNSSHPFYIKNYLPDPSLADMCFINKEESIDSLLSKLESFSTLMYRNNKLSNFLQNLECSSLVLESTRFDPKIKSFLLTNKDSSSLRLSSNETLPSSKTDRSTTTLKVSESTQTKRSFITKEIKSEEPKNNISPLSPNDITQKELQVATGNKIKITSGVKNIIPKLEKTLPDPAFQNLKKIALEELNGLKTRNPEKYTLLKQNYINSLSEEKRQILLDVHERVTEDVFDSHLRHGLLKYMIDNPSSWSSAKNA